MIFVILKDRTGLIQVSIDKAQNQELVKQLEGVSASSVLEFKGVMAKSEYVKMGGKEFIPSSLKILSLADTLPLDETANIDTRMDYRWIDLRSEKNNLIYKVQTAFVDGMRSFLIQNDFTEIHTPKLISTASLGINLGSVVIIVLPLALCGNSSTALSFLNSFSIFGKTKSSINLLINVDFPVLTGPTTPM